MENRLPKTLLTLGGMVLFLLVFGFTVPPKAEAASAATDLRVSPVIVHGYSVDDIKAVIEHFGRFMKWHVNTSTESSITLAWRYASGANITIFNAPMDTFQIRALRFDFSPAEPSGVKVTAAYGSGESSTAAREDDIEFAAMNTGVYAWMGLKLVESYFNGATGLGVVLEAPQDGGSYRIATVFAGSAAEEAGLEVGDAVARVAGIPLERLESVARSHLWGRKDLEVSLSILREEMTSIEKTLVCREFPPQTKEIEQIISLKKATERKDDRYTPQTVNIEIIPKPSPKKKD